MQSIETTIPEETTIAPGIRPELWAALLIGFITLLLTTLITLPVLLNHEDGPLAFAHIGTRYSEGIPDGTKGYDGQFAYFIARDGAAAVPYIDGPALRYQRILYPLMARVLSLGQDELVPWALLIVNILSHSIAAGLLAYLLRRSDAPAAAALIYSVWIGNLFAIRFDLNEPLCFALALGGIVAYQHERYRLTIILLLLSTLAKELGLVIAAGIALHAFWNRRVGWSVLIFGGPLLMFLVWWGIMRLWLGTLPTIYPAAKIHFIPFEGMVSLLTDDRRLGNVEQATRVIQFVMILYFLGLPTFILLVAALKRFWMTRNLKLMTAITLGCAGFVMTMPDVSWQDQVAVYRVGLPVIIAGLLYTGTFHRRRLKWLAALWVPATLIIFLIPGLWSGGA